MARKPLTLRTAVITTAATAAGSTAGALAEAITAHLGYHQPGAGQLATAVTTLWVLEEAEHPDRPRRSHRPPLSHSRGDRPVQITALQPRGGAGRSAATRTKYLFDTSRLGNPVTIRRPGQLGMGGHHPYLSTSGETPSTSEGTPPDPAHPRHQPAHDRDQGSVEAARESLVIGT